MEQWPPPGGFAERMLQRTHFFVSDLKKESDRINLEHLDFLICISAANRFSRNETVDGQAVAFAVATKLLRFFLGDDWTNDNVFGCHTEVSRQNKAGRAFLQSESIDDPEVNFRWQERVQSLAECLLNLQDVPGIDHRIALMREDSLESALGELHCAQLMAAPDLGLRFIIPKGKRKGEDYDCEIMTPVGRVVCCEIKTKEEGTELGRTTIGNTLEHARKQLPKGRPGAVFLKIPEKWATDRELKEILDASIAKIFRQSKRRLVAVAVVWESWASVGTGRVIARGYVPVYNTGSPLFSGDIAPTFNAMGSYKNSNWIDLTNYASGRLPAIVDFFNRQYLGTQALDGKTGQDYSQ